MEIQLQQQAYIQNDLRSASDTRNEGGSQTGRYTVESIVKSRSQSRLGKFEREDRCRRQECEWWGVGGGEQQTEDQKNETQVQVQKRDRG